MHVYNNNNNNNNNDNDNDNNKWTVRTLLSGSEFDVELH